MPDVNELFNFVKEKLKIDGSEGDDILALHVDAAKEKLLGAGVPESDKSLYKLTVLLQVMLDYENYDKSLNTVALQNAITSNILLLRPYGGDTDDKT